MDLAPLAGKQGKEESQCAAEVNTGAPTSHEAGAAVPAVPMSKTLGVVMTTVCHGMIVGFTFYMLYLSVPFPNLFTWHPLLMTIGGFLLMAEAIMAMSPNNHLASNLQRQSRVRLHFILQAIAAGFMFAGFVVIFINKFNKNKHHFETWHAIVGLVAVICVAITASGGVVALYALRLKKWIKPAQIKFLHNFIGILTFLMCVIAVVLGLFSGWFTRNASYSSQIICSVLVSLAAIFALESAIKSAFSRFRNLYFSY